VAAYVRFDETLKSTLPDGRVLKSTLPDGRVSARNDSDWVVAESKIVLGGMAPSPIDVKEAGQALIGKPLDDEAIQTAAEACYVKARPLDNTDFVMNWRKQMTRQYTIRALEALLP
jgi:CO/xanthine dehydrogenase FAD-binding subunit